MSTVLKYVIPVKKGGRMAHLKAFLVIVFSVVSLLCLFLSSNSRGSDLRVELLAASVVFALLAGAWRPIP
jgi:hypothetical protein